MSDFIKIQSVGEHGYEQIQVSQLWLKIALVETIEFFFYYKKSL